MSMTSILSHKQYVIISYSSQKVQFCVSDGQTLLCQVHWHWHWCIHAKSAPETYRHRLACPIHHCFCSFSDLFQLRISVWLHFARKRARCSSMAGKYPFTRKTTHIYAIYVQPDKTALLFMLWKLSYALVYTSIFHLLVNIQVRKDFSLLPIK
jgi:hypothetical protein